MEQCDYCKNKKECKENNWVTTFDTGYKIKGIKEYLCDNFSLEHGCSITCVKNCDVCDELEKE